jgi:hypothetical protein
MMKHKSSAPKCDRIFSKISSGWSFTDLGSWVMTEGSEHASFLPLYEGDADAICT